MPPETDPKTLNLLLRILQDPASNVVKFTATAMGMGHRKDEGLDKLFPADWTPSYKKAELRRALAEFLKRGGTPNRTQEKGDREMRLDAVTFHEFRINVESASLYVKVRIDDDDDPDDPIMWIISVKRDDRAVR